MYFTDFLLLLMPNVFVSCIIRICISELINAYHHLPSFSEAASWGLHILYTFDVSPYIITELTDYCFDSVHVLQN